MGLNMIHIISSYHNCMPVIQSCPCPCDDLCVHSVLYYCYCHLLDVTSSQLIVCIKRRIRNLRNVNIERERERESLYVQSMPCRPTTVVQPQDMNSSTNTAAVHAAIVRNHFDL